MKLAILAVASFSMAGALVVWSAMTLWAGLRAPLAWGALVAPGAWLMFGLYLAGSLAHTLWKAYRSEREWKRSHGLTNGVQ